MEGRQLLQQGQPSFWGRNQHATLWPALLSRACWTEEFTSKFHLAGVPMQCSHEDPLASQQKPQERRSWTSRTKMCRSSTTGIGIFLLIGITRYFSYMDVGMLHCMEAPTAPKAPKASARHTREMPYAARHTRDAAQHRFECPRCFVTCHVCNGCFIRRRHMDFCRCGRSPDSEDFRAITRTMSAQSPMPMLQGWRHARCAGGDWPCVQANVPTLALQLSNGQQPAENDLSF